MKMEQVINLVGKTGLTKTGFGRMLKAGIPATVIKQQGTDIVIKLDEKIVGTFDIYHGKVNEFELIVG